MNHMSGRLSRHDSGSLVRLCLMIITAAFLFIPVNVSAAKQATAANGVTTYFAVDDTLYSLNTKTGSYKKIKKLGTPYYISEVIYHNGYLYFTGNYYRGSDASADYICRIKTNGTGFKKMAPGQHPAIYGGRLYYIQHKVLKDSLGTYTRAAAVGSMKVTGADQKTLVKLSGSYPYSYGLAVVSGRVFYIDSKTLSSCTTSGKKVRKYGDCDGLITDGKALYCTGGSYVYKMTVGGTRTTLLTRKMGPYSPYTYITGIKNGYLYLCDRYYTSSSRFYKYQLSSKKTSTINSYHISGMASASGPYILVHRYTGNGHYEGARMTVAGKSYKLIQKYFRS